MHLQGKRCLIIGGTTGGIGRGGISAIVGVCAGGLG